MTEHNLARAPDTKSAGPELADAFDEFMTTFEAFKDGNDRRLAELESKGADVLTVEKVDRISKALDEQKRAIDNLSLKRIRPALDRGGRAMPSEHKQAFDAYKGLPSLIPPILGSAAHLGISSPTAQTRASTRSGERPPDSPSGPKSHISSSSSAKRPACFTLPWL